VSVVCNVCIVAKQCVLPQICMKKQIGNGLWEIGLVTDDVTVTLKGQGHDPNILRAEYLENSVQMLFSNKFC